MHPNYHILRKYKQFYFNDLKKFLIFLLSNQDKKIHCILYKRRVNYLFYKLNKYSLKNNLEFKNLPKKIIKAIN